MSMPATEDSAIERLADKVRGLIARLDRTRTELAQVTADNQRLIDENQRLAAELESMNPKLADAEQTGAELADLQAEREEIRKRVTEMLADLDALSV